MVSVNSFNHIQLTDDDRERIRRSLGNLTVTQATYPLQAAVMISPLVLLDPTKIAFWQWNRSDMLKVCQVSIIYIWY